MKRTVCLLLLLGCGTDPPSGLCDATELGRALAAAGSGTRITVGLCRVEGDFVLPAGVTLAGGGPGSVLAGSDVTVRGEVGGVVLEDLTLEGGARAALLLRGAGAARLSRVAIEADTGVAFGAEGLTKLELIEVALRGPIDASNEDSVPYPPDRSSVSTHGLAAAGITELLLTDVSARGFAGTGVLAIDSALRWEQGDASENLGLGLHVQGGQAELIGVSLDRTLRGTWGVETYGGAFTASAAVESTDLTADDNWYGLLHHGGTARHLNLSAGGNQNAAVWTQFTTAFELTGALADNDFAGFVAFRASGVHLHDATIAETHQVLRPKGEVGTVMIGDGIQLVESTGGARLADLDLIDNERVGLLLELGGGSFAAMEILDVRVQQTVGNGCVLQNGTAPPDWDQGVTRTGVTQAADRAAAQLETVAVVGPCGRPTELSNLTALGL